MTDLEKARVDELRSQGLTYQEVAKRTGVGLSTVKMHFLRMKSPDARNRTCLLCGKSLGKDVPAKKKFCTDKCRCRYWAAHPERLGCAERHLFDYPVCGKRFYAYKPAKFCSLECYHRSRRKAGQKNA